MLQPVLAGICSTPTEQGSMHCSSSEQDFLWNSPSPLVWALLGQSLSTGCCHLYPLHPTPMWQEGPQGSDVKHTGIFLLVLASNVCCYKGFQQSASVWGSSFAARWQLSQTQLFIQSPSSPSLAPELLLSPSFPSSHCSPSSCLLPVHP